ncbi:MAG: pyrroloquinoline quinone biosynthesis protein PqqB [Asgard group archaeon]|nr:pyrroloquinoline quinone biosynthesis protein PqqB [Asgard group archaeon]
MKIVFLGSAQDAGIPQINCLCENCQEARKNSSFKCLASSIAFIDESSNKKFIIDASPDIKEQIEILRLNLDEQLSNNNVFLDGFFLTHAHFGHCAGLWSFGKECMNAKKIPVYCSQKMKNFLENNHPYSHLISDRNIEIKELKFKDNQFGTYSIEPILVPHRNEYADTVGFVIKINKSLLYLPDLDYWTEELIKLAQSVDISIIDGTFFSKSELKTYHEVPHPEIKESMDLLKEHTNEIYFTHFNHTNNIIRKNSKERKEAIKNGFKIAYDGLVLTL